VSPELERYYEALEEMFTSVGWAHFKEVVHKRRVSDEITGWSGQTGEQLVFKSGCIHTLREIENFQDEHRIAYQELKDSEEDDGEAE